MPKETWTAAQKEYLKQCRKAGIPASIACIILGKSRSAVLGKYNRMYKKSEYVQEGERKPYLHEYTGWKYVRDNPRD